MIYHGKLHQGSQDGFTLLEMIVVLAIISLVSTMGLLQFRSQTTNVSLANSAKAISAVARNIRYEAIANGRETQLIINMRNKQITSPAGDELYAIDRGLSIDVKTATFLSKEAIARFIFYPDGSSSGGSIVLRDGRSNKSQIDIFWLTGLPRIVDTGL